MRTYGRLKDNTGQYQWVVVETDEEGFDDYVWLTTLIQTLKLVRGESPFYGNYGIPAQVSLIQQVFPDFYVALTQQQYAQYFAALVVSKLSDPTPHYKVDVTLQKGVKVQADFFTLPNVFVLGQSALDSGDVLR